MAGSLGGGGALYGVSRLLDKARGKGPKKGANTATAKQFRERKRQNAKSAAKKSAGKLRGTKSVVKARGASTNGKKRNNRSGMKALTKSGG